MTMPTMAPGASVRIPMAPVSDAGREEGDCDELDELAVLDSTETTGVMVLPESSVLVFVTTGGFDEVVVGWDVVELNVMDKVVKDAVPEGVGVGIVRTFEVVVTGFMVLMTVKVMGAVRENSAASCSAF